MILEKYTAPSGLEKRRNEMWSCSRGYGYAFTHGLSHDATLWLSGMTGRRLPGKFASGI
jgi:hypothetical protein